MKNRFSLLFYFKKPKQHTKNAPLPIYMRISIGCERTEISTQRKWKYAQWNAAASHALNGHLNTLQGRVYASLSLTQEAVTVAKIIFRFIDVFTTKGTPYMRMSTPLIFYSAAFHD